MQSWKEFSITVLTGDWDLHVNDWLFFMPMGLLVSISIYAKSCQAHTHGWSLLSQIYFGVDSLIIVLGNSHFYTNTALCMELLYPEIAVSNNLSVVFVHFKVFVDYIWSIAINGRCTRNVIQHCACLSSLCCYSFSYNHTLHSTRSYSAGMYAKQASWQLDMGEGIQTLSYFTDAILRLLFQNCCSLLL